MTDQDARHVILGLARTRRTWPTELTRWVTTGELHAEFVRCVSVAEARALLAGGRRFSVLLVDRDALGIDRDLLTAAEEAGCRSLVVADRDDDLTALGAGRIVPDFDVATLRIELDRHPAVPTLTGVPDLMARTDHGTSLRTPLAPLVAVTGAGGSGVSTIAMALAQGFAGDIHHADTVLLADLALDSGHALLHDVGDVIPGVLELVEAHRTGAPTPARVRELTFDIERSRYRLLLGLRRHRDWTAVRPAAFTAALGTMRRNSTLVVAEVSPDFEGESDTGSTDVEDRNHMARRVAAEADVVVVVGTGSFTGVHRLIEVVRRLRDAGVDSDRIVPVLNHAPARRRDRHRLVEDVAAMLDDRTGAAPTHQARCVPTRDEIALAAHDGRRVPSFVERLVHPTVSDVLESVEPRGGGDADLLAGAVPVVPGSLGLWLESD